MFLQRLIRFTRNAKLLERASAQVGQVQKQSRFYNVPKVVNGTTVIGMGLWGLMKQKEEKETIVTTKEVILAKADALFDQGKYKEIYDLLSNYRDSGDVEILWRISRALYNMSKSASDIEGAKMVYEAYDLITSALNIKEDHWAVHKWLAILLDAKSNYEGMKSRIKELYNIKKHMLRAIELNPKDATTYYMLGNWCYQIADLAWYQRNIAKVVFGEPPTSSFEEASTYFEAAEKVEPNFYSHNLLMLGKTYLKLNRKEEALKYLKMAADYPARIDDDRDANQEAQKLLSETK